MSIAPSRDNPSPHDWPEDWANPHDDNGCYLHVCPECSVQFTGHKRRKGLCKACSTKRDREVERRASLLATIGLDRRDWVLIPSDEWDKLVVQLMHHIIDVQAERELRRKLAAALVVADGTNSNVLYWGHPGRHRDTSLNLLVQSSALDEYLEDREKKA